MLRMVRSVLFFGLWIQNMSYCGLNAWQMLGHVPPETLFFTTPLTGYNTSIQNSIHCNQMKIVRLQSVRDFWCCVAYCCFNGSSRTFKIIHGLKRIGRLGKAKTRSICIAKDKTRRIGKWTLISKEKRIILMAMVIWVNA